MKNALLALLIFSPLVHAADVNLIPDGQEVVVRGITVACYPEQQQKNPDEIPDDVLVGMGKADRLGACMVREYTAGTLELIINSNGTLNTLATEHSVRAMAKVLRRYLNAGACR